MAECLEPNCKEDALPGLVVCDDHINHCEHGNAEVDDGFWYCPDCDAEGEDVEPIW